MAAMHPANEKGLSAPATQTQAMQTSAQFGALHPALQPKLERPLSLRQSRAVHALLLGGVPTNALPRIAGCNNGADLIAKLRRKLGLEIPCPMHSVTDRDGRTVEAGEYRLTAVDREKLKSILLALAPKEATA